MLGQTLVVPSTQCMTLGLTPLNLTQSSHVKNGENKAYGKHLRSAYYVPDTGNQDREVQKGW